MKVAIYPGAFDPVTNGHLDVIERSARLFERLIVAVAINQEKTSLFSLDERVEMLREVTGQWPNVEIDSFEGLLTEYARAKGAVAVIRGLRAISDFEIEFQMALMNRHLEPSVETLFLMASEQHSFLSSRIVKEVMSLGGDGSEFVPAVVERRLREKLGAGGGAGA
ncbi:phosphopantetheine adenylyltransferase [candidate division TA06 bacterium DG_24]|uniref:Phosphopantetheine adenylyltransferase n=2 Tax=Bacteria division TA06 TaxID=1156500 RepID=A0A0S8JFQ0_UNCT6|nr:MAG: phosphopantetheine adenylyltransferase [candidate division TA06 bacterium DG_24]KPL08612.1 MAG: phosphopantetheine adenylyltransferase [candidate division TA06 bacterium SM1_40]